MSENPYESPQAEGRAIGVLSGRREDLKSVATYQKGIMVCILVYLILVASSFAAPEELRVIVQLLVFAVGIAGTVFVFLLATKVYGTGLGILLGILTLMPCLGLIVLLVVNNKATTILRQNGIKVGLMGANLDDI